MTLLRQKNRLP